MPAVELTVATCTDASQLLARIGAASHRNRLDAELREEIDQHIELRRQQLIESGVPPADALAMARRQFGNVTRVREDTRAMWSFPALDTVLQDLRYGARMMRRSPAVSLIAIVSLGLGIGGAAAVFGLADVLLVRQLPVRAPEQLAVFRWSSGPVSVFESLNGNAQRDERDFSVSSTSFSRPGVRGDAERAVGSSRGVRIRRSVQGQPLGRRPRRRRQRSCRVRQLLQRARPLRRRRPPDHERRRSSRRTARGGHQLLRRGSAGSAAHR